MVTASRTRVHGGVTFVVIALLVALSSSATAAAPLQTVRTSSTSTTESVGTLPPRKGLTATFPVVAGNTVVTASFTKSCGPRTVDLTQFGKRVGSSKAVKQVTVEADTAEGDLVVTLSGGPCQTGYSIRVTTSSTDPVVAPAPAPVPQTGRMAYSVTEFGAVGNGVVDDTVALQKALDSLYPGDELYFPTGLVFRHTDVLRVRTAGVLLGGNATLLATNESRSAFFVDADGVTVENLTFKMGATTRRWVAYEQMKLRIGPRAGVTIRNVTIDGSAAAGVFVGGASGFTLEDVTVRSTRADGIHMTEGANNGRVIRPVVSGVGDDGVAVVSYASGGLAHHIEVISPRIRANTWGRGVSVVGGTDITYRDVYVEHSNAAAVYVAAEPSYNTWGSARVTVDGGRLVSSNDSSTVDHGAVLVYNGQAAYAVTDITLKNLTISDTRMTASRQVGVISENGAVQQRIVMTGIAVNGGPSKVYWSNTSASVTLLGWTRDGVALADRIGW